jgi:predicted hotdog family 3-hydroxylacyl-ACP dehydratase
MLSEHAPLPRDGIARLIPHSGTMCLLDRLDDWDARRVVCSAGNHRDASHPLRTQSGLLASCLIEYAAQAMALHGALVAQAKGRSVSPGYLASVRGVRLQCLRLDDLPRAIPDELCIEATWQAGDERQILYAFNVKHGGRPIAEGRAAVVLNSALSDA